MRRAPSRLAGVPAVVAALLFALAATGCSGARAAPGLVPPVVDRYPIIPAPRRLEAGSGEFRLDRKTRIMLSDPGSRELRTLSELLAAPSARPPDSRSRVSTEPASDQAPHALRSGWPRARTPLIRRAIGWSLPSGA
jgi:hypothetical protein